jgi:hypothetical protein
VSVGNPDVIHMSVVGKPDIETRKHLLAEHVNRDLSRISWYRG